MRAKAVQHQHKNIIPNLINEQPVRFDMTLTDTFVFSCQFMVSVIRI